MSDHEVSKGADRVPAEQTLDVDDRPSDHQTGRTVRATVFAISVLTFAIWTVFGTVHTHLGVKAPEWDKDGREHIWRVWWRARDDMVSTDSSAFVVLYIGLTLALVLLSAVALWIAVVPADPRDSRHSDQ